MTLFNDHLDSTCLFRRDLRYSWVVSPSFAGGFSGSEVPFTTYIVNKYQRIGLLIELEAEWNSKNPNRKNAASISAFGADNAIPWYLNATYKVRFNLGKK